MWSQGSKANVHWFFSSNLQLPGLRHEQRHMKCVPKWLLTKDQKRRPKKPVSIREMAKDKQLRKMAPGNCLQTEAQSQTAQACVRLQTANHQLSELNYETAAHISE